MADRHNLAQSLLRAEVLDQHLPRLRLPSLLLLGFRLLDLHLLDFPLPGLCGSLASMVSDLVRLEWRWLVYKVTTTWSQPLLLCTVLKIGRGS